MFKKIKSKFNTFKFIFENECYDVIIHKLLGNHSNALPFKENHRYIILSSHGTGLSSFLSFMMETSKIKATDCRTTEKLVRGGGA
ncbi:hypothetical protein [Helicobacter sp. 11S02596-1]|uniref:hypothetical protein n=1 Tax=Helicobacter sp. 11S02596-1 TaxID=1476194 RepID=UPI000BA69B80|nr:hypothetical protein [Helicobacter sp. 11S02596-1]PAF44719.1 hypothetical protein BJI48_01640 [Helicobacter sp. 11S02596-1]